MTVESFDPSQIDGPGQVERVEALLELAQAQTTASPDNLEPLASSSQVQQFALLATTSEWVKELPEQSGAVLVWLIRYFTLGEAAHASWQAGAKSPVVVLARALKAQGAYPSELTGWIKQHSKNRFLPHGSLMDRL